MAITSNVPSDNFEDLQRDVRDATKWVNGQEPFPNRAGEIIKPIPVIQQEWDQAATGQFVQQTQGLVAQAEAFASQAETAAEAATINADVYVSTNVGLTSTSLGQQFQVAGNKEIIRYRHDAGPVATEVARYPSANEVLKPSRTGLKNAAIDTFFRKFVPDTAIQYGKVRFHQTSSGPVSSWEVRQGVSPFNGGAFVKTSVGESSLGGPRYYLSDCGASAGDTVTIKVWIKATIGSPVVYCPARPLSASGALLGTQISAVPSTITAGSQIQLMTIEFATPALTDSIFIYPYTNTVGTEFAIVAHSVYKGLATDTPDYPPLGDDDLTKLRVDLLEVNEGREAWPDPIFRHFELNTTDQLGKPRYFGNLTDLSFTSNNLRKGRALRVDGNSSLLAGPRVWLDEIGAVAGDTIQFSAEIVGSGASAVVAWRALDVNGALIGLQGNTQTVVTSQTPTLVSGSSVIPEGAVSIRFYPRRVSGSGTFDILSLWGGIKNLRTVPTDSDAAFTALLASDNKARIDNFEPTSGASERVAGVYAPQRLRQLAAKRAILEDGGNTTLKIGLFGDSWTNSSERWYDLIRSKFDAEFGVDAAGWVSANTQIAVPTGVSRVRIGTWTDVRVGTTFGPDTSHTSTIDSAAKLTIGGTGVTSFVVHWVSQVDGGSFDVGLVGGSKTTVSTNSAQAHGFTVIAGNSVASLEITINTVGNGVILLGVETLANTAPVTIHKLGSGGSTAARFVDIPSAIFTSTVQNLGLDVAVIMLGTNDMSGNAPPATFSGSIEQIVNRIKSALPLCDILLVAPGDNGLTGRVYTMQQYADVLFALAKKDNYAMIDYVDILGPYESANQRGIYNDDSHVNVRGGRVMVNTLWKYIFSST